MSTVPVDPCFARLTRDLQSAEVERGADEGNWRVHDLQWPLLYVSFTCGDGKSVALRIRVDNYPSLAPAGQLWDLAAGQLLAPPAWPTGPTASTIFRQDWSIANGHAPYMACDRVALQGHEAWRHDVRAWHPGRTIAFYLQEIHYELRSAALPVGLAA